MVIRGGSRQDHHDALAQAHTPLGQAEGLAALFLRRRAHEGGVGSDLVARTQARREQDKQRSGQTGPQEEQGENTAGGDGERTHDPQSYQRSHETAEHDRARGLPEGRSGQDDADGGRPAVQIPREGGHHAFRGVVERRQPAEEHRDTQGRAGKHEPCAGDDTGQPGRLVMPASRRGSS